MIIPQMLPLRPKIINADPSAAITRKLHLAIRSDCISNTPAYQPLRVVPIPPNPSSSSPLEDWQMHFRPKQRNAHIWSAARCFVQVSVRQTPAAASNVKMEANPPPVTAAPADAKLTKPSVPRAVLPKTVTIGEGLIWLNTPRRQASFEAYPISFQFGVHSEQHLSTAVHGPQCQRPNGSDVLIGLFTTKTYRLLASRSSSGSLDIHRPNRGL